MTEDEIEDIISDESDLSNNTNYMVIIYSMKNCKYINA